MGIDAEMLVKVTPPLSERQVKRVAYEMGGAFGVERFFVSSGGYERRALTVLAEYEQDGETLHSAPGEQFVGVSLGGRFYGEGYERGDLPLYITLAEWLEQRLAQEPGVRGVTILYGGDSSGVCAAPFDRKRRAELFAHFVKHGHRPYGNWDLGEIGHNRTCSFCEEKMSRYLWGGHNLVAGYGCSGCGFTEETRDGGATWVTKTNVGGSKVRETEAVRAS